MKRLLALLLFGAVSHAHGQTTATLQLNFPPMPINRMGTALLLTDREPFTGTVTLSDGTVLEVTDADIPPTYVRGLAFHKTVDACGGNGELTGGGTIVLHLPPEPVRLRNGTMTALAITATAVVTLPGGAVGTGTVLFPDCPTQFIALGHYLAAAVVATGSVTFP